MREWIITTTKFIPILFIFKIIKIYNKKENTEWITIFAFSTQAMKKIFPQFSQFFDILTLQWQFEQYQFVSMATHFATPAILKATAYQLTKRCVFDNLLSNSIRNKL